MKLSQGLREAFEALEEERDRFVLRRRYVDGATYGQIAIDLMISAPRARQLALRAERRLAAHLLKKPVPPDLILSRVWRVFGWPVKIPEPFHTLDEILDALSAYSLVEREGFLKEPEHSNIVARSRR